MRYPSQNSIRGQDRVRIQIKIEINIEIKIDHEFSKISNPYEHPPPYPTLISTMMSSSTVMSASRFITIMVFGVLSFNLHPHLEVKQFGPRGPRGY